MGRGLQKGISECDECVEHIHSDSRLLLLQPTLEHSREGRSDYELERQIVAIIHAALTVRSVGCGWGVRDATMITHRWVAACDMEPTLPRLKNEEVQYCKSPECAINHKMCARDGMVQEENLAKVGFVSNQISNYCKPIFNHLQH